MTSVKRIASGGALMLALCLIPRLQASYTLNVVQSGSNVVETGSGTINTAALTSNGSASDGANVWPSFPGESVISVGSTATAPVVYFTSISGPATFGSGPQVLATSGSGPVVAVFGNTALYLPSGYVSGSVLSSTATWTNQTIAGLGLTPGVYTYTWGSGGTADSFVLTIGGSASVPSTPAPSSLYLLGTALAAARLIQIYRMRRAA